MKKIVAGMLAGVLALTAPGALSFAMDHEKMVAGMGNVAHEEVIEGVKATFKFISMTQSMKEMNMEMPKGMKETHHLMVEFRDIRSGKALTAGQVKVKIQGPDKSEQVKELISMSGMAGMRGHFGADFVLSQKGKYGVMTKFKLKDGKTRSAKFWNEVK